MHRVSYTSGNQAPVARISATPTSGPVPLAVSFDGRGSSDPDAGDTIASWSWDLNGDGAFGDATGATATYTYTTPGTLHRQAAGNRQPGAGQRPGFGDDRG